MSTFTLAISWLITSNLPWFMDLTFQVSYAILLFTASDLPMNIQDWFPLGWSGWISLQSKGLSKVFSNTTIQKYHFFSAQLSLSSNSHIHTPDSHFAFLHFFSIGMVLIPVSCTMSRTSFHSSSGDIAGSKTVCPNPGGFGEFYSSGSIPGSGRCPGEGNGNPLQYSYLENPMDREAW